MPAGADDITATPARVPERAGVISPGRGRLTVHDPGALDGYVP